MSRLGRVQGHARQELQSADTAERKVSETWMVLEFCSKGSLQDALDRHACCSSLLVPCSFAVIPTIAVIATITVIATIAVIATTAVIATFAVISTIADVS